MSDYVPSKKIDKEEVWVRARSLRIASQRRDDTRISRSEEKARNQKNSGLTIIEHQIPSNWQSLLKSCVQVAHSFEAPYYNFNGQCTVQVKWMSKKKDHFAWTKEKLSAILEDIDGYADQLLSMLKNKSLNDAFLKKRLRNYRKKSDIWCI